MKKALNLTAFSAILVIASFLVVSTAQAQQSPPLPTQTNAVTSVQCLAAQEKIKGLITRVETTTKTQTATFNAIKAKVTARITSSTELGYDQTAALTTARDDIQTKADAFAAKATAYTASLRTSSTQECSTGTDVFVVSITSARTLLIETRAASDATKESITTNTIPALQSYATWLGAQPTDEEATN